MYGSTQIYSCRWSSSRAQKESLITIDVSLRTRGSASFLEQASQRRKQGLFTFERWSGQTVSGPTEPSWCPCAIPPGPIRSPGAPGRLPRWGRRLLRSCPPMRCAWKTQVRYMGQAFWEDRKKHRGHQPLAHTSPFSPPHCPVLIPVSPLPACLLPFVLARWLSVTFLWDPLPLLIRCPLLAHVFF